MNGDLISRDAVLEVIRVTGVASAQEKLRIMGAVRAVPSVEAEPVVHAHWVDRPDGAYRICTNCNCGVPTMPKPPAWFRCPVCGAHMDEKRMVPMYLGKCDETDCEHWRWCGDSYHDRNTECYCLLNGKRVYRHEADEKRIECPLGKMMVEEEE